MPRVVIVDAPVTLPTGCKCGTAVVAWVLPHHSTDGLQGKQDGHLQALAFRGLAGWRCVASTGGVSGNGRFAAQQPSARLARGRGGRAVVVLQQRGDLVAVT